MSWQPTQPAIPLLQHPSSAVKIDRAFAAQASGVPPGDLAAKCAALPVICYQTKLIKASAWTLVSLVLLFTCWFCLRVYLTARELHLRSLHEVKLARILSGEPRGWAASS